MKHLITLSIILLILTGCAPTQQTEIIRIQDLPTRIPTTTPEYNNAIEAERVITAFLDLWKRGDYAQMYSLISLSSQEAFPYDTFVNFYQSTADEIQLDNQTFTLIAQARESNRVMVFLYDMTFTSAIMGEFSDSGREMRLVIEDNLQAWRVAWSPGDIFNAMGRGGAVRLETFPPLRANIYDRNGEILADMNGRVVIARVVPQDIPNWEACITTLATATNQTNEQIQAKIAQSNPTWLTDMGLIEAQTYLQWESSLLTDCATQFDYQYTRRYLDGSLTAHIIGTVGYPDESQIPALELAGFRQDSIIGKSGIEASWDAVLRGTPGGRLSIVSAEGVILQTLVERRAEPSKSVYLTIDADLQRFVYRAISEAYANAGESWGATSNGASAVILNVRTGEILAMVSYPSFDANAFTAFPIMGKTNANNYIGQIQTDPRKPQLNRAAQGRYPSGSVFKVISAIAALDSDNYTFDERYMSIGTWNRDILRTDWRNGGHGSLTLAGALTHSCNSCFYEVGYRLNGIDPYLLPRYANLLGLGVPTGMTDIPTSNGFIGTPETKPNLFPEPWTFSDAVDMAIGQGMVEVSPLQMVEVYALIANGGTHYRPFLVHHTALLDDIYYQFTPEVLDEAHIDPIVLTYVRNGLCDVVTGQFGTASHIFRNSPLLEGVGTCGKTGTAQNQQGLPHAWFMAYAPKDTPEIAIGVMVENSGDGSAVAAPITRRILEYYYLGITD
ncbi:MAG: penicillin-binding transpeptidase domain-containing protein [Anaerolineae bacterium]|nr:penicillin-binding transpeptidase domain-containing protein [Anaerolineae bacterium]